MPPHSTESRPLRILQIVPAYYPAVRYGGPIKSVHGLSAALARRGHDVHVYTSNMDGDQNLTVPLSHPVTIDNVAVHYFPVSPLRRLCWCPAMSAKLKSTIASFDVVHLQSVFLWPTWAGARAAQSANVPYVISPRGMLGREVIRRKSRWVKSAWITVVESRTLRNAQAVHVTADIEHQEINALGLDLPEVRCIPNGVDLPKEHSPLAAGPYADLPQPYALFLSRINWKKGLDRLIKAWAHVPQLSLVIAGNDEEQYQRHLDEIVRTQGLTNRVHFIGSVDDKHKWALYENAVMFVLPSYSENFGNVVAEAMAMGCPVVVTPEVGLAPLVEEYQAGVVTQGEPAQLAASVRSLLDNPLLRTQMGHSGRKAVAQKLSWEAIALNMETTYRTAIDRSADSYALRHGISIRGT